mmetsp:Transcript_8528/g.7558  ORF Transcript_8528/g.7558 Transcript_8528/m.7558 type:complete len:141 (+) Transcript_8528:49-471(+)
MSNFFSSISRNSAFNLHKRSQPESPQSQYPSTSVSRSDRNDAQIQMPIPDNQPSPQHSIPEHVKILEHGGNKKVNIDGIRTCWATPQQNQILLPNESAKTLSEPTKDTSNRFKMLTSTNLANPTNLLIDNLKDRGVITNE